MPDPLPENDPELPPDAHDDPGETPMGWPAALVWISGFIALASIFHSCCYGHLPH